MRPTPFLISVLLLCGLAAPADAVTNIRFERWTVSRHVRPENAPPPVWQSSVAVSFDATVTPADLDPVHGLRFAIAERQPGGNQVLAQVEIPPCAALPAPGADVNIACSIRIVATVEGRLAVNQVNGWSASWCDVPQQQLCSRTNYAVPLATTAGTEAFEFVLVDENGTEGAFPTPDDVAVVDPVPGGGAEFVAPDFADSGKIGIYADSGGNLCSAAVQPFVPFRWYIVANTAGMTRCGVWTFEIGVDPLPPGMFMNVTPSPHAMVSTGTLFGGTAGLGFACERDASDAIVLYTLDGVTSQPIQDYNLRVGAGNPPSNDAWPYPWAQLCPFPAGIRRRMHGADFIINPLPGHDCDATVPVEAKSWSAMKSLYR